MSGPAIYDADGRERTKRGPTPAERRALADLVRTVRRAAAQVIAEQERERRAEE